MSPPPRIQHPFHLLIYSLSNNFHSEKDSKTTIQLLPLFGFCPPDLTRAILIFSLLYRLPFRIIEPFVFVSPPPPHHPQVLIFLFVFATRFRNTSRPLPPIFSDSPSCIHHKSTRRFSWIFEPTRRHPKGAPLHERSLPFN